MTDFSVDWSEVSTRAGDDLKREVFSIIKRASAELQDNGSDNPKLLEVVPRLADMIESTDSLSSFRPLLSSLARAVGLWNYIDKENSYIEDLIVAESTTAPEIGGITFHREQIAALNVLFSGRNLILSAPTSFGKSLLIDALLASGKYGRVAIVLPTIALLDEFRRRLSRRFGGAYDIIMHQSEVPKKSNVIFLGTQERLINRTDLHRIDLTVVDEFYKLDPTRRDGRSVSLNVAVRRLISRSRQFFFLGPNIDNVPVSVDGRWEFSFLKTRFSTVAVDTFDMSRVRDKKASLLDEVAEDSRWPALVFVSSPDKANSLASEAAKEMAVSDDSSEFADWLELNVGQKWSLSRTVRNGFGVHHGRLPRAIASQMVRMFNDLRLPVLFCTSTLIEGVNTAAKSVLIYDKKIDMVDYDFFTFSNIKGRAGRLGQHHVGQVFLYNAPPVEEETEVSPTLFGDEDNAPDDYIVYLDEEDRSEFTENRLSILSDELELDGEGLRLAASVGIDIATELKVLVRNRLKISRALSWGGVPKYENIEALCEVVSHVTPPRKHGAVSYKQLAYFTSSLMMSKTFAEYLLDHDASFRGDDDQYEGIFKFLRGCEYGLPQVFSLVGLFVKAEGYNAEYSLFLRNLSRWFKPECLKELDEEGIPIQMSERLYREGDTRFSLMGRLKEAVVTGDAVFSPFERGWLVAALDMK